MIISNEEKKNSQIFTRKNPAIARLKERYLLTGIQSSKQVYHLSLDLTEAPLSFKVGDSIGILPQNDPAHVEEILTALRVLGDQPITERRSGACSCLRDFLSLKANLSRVTSDLIRLFHTQATMQNSPSPLGALLEAHNKAALIEYLNTHELLDLLSTYSQVEVSAEQVCNHLSPLLPRFYSIASSPLLAPTQVDLTVALSVYHLRQTQRYGVTSRFLCHLAKLRETPIPIYVQPAHHFSLPTENSKGIIMVGPGTGVAPFRAFLQERIYQGATGKNWLFFGEREQLANYYYQEFWEELSSKGHLKLNLAFSRDQAYKKYVQHSMYEHAQELFSWLEEGAHFYVCGDAERMAKDVDATLHRIVQEQGGFSTESTKAYVKSLKMQKRYLTDVY